jgi:glycosyltransferase involved in cell wall biosynthesis
MRPPQARVYDLVHLGTLSRRRAIFLADVVGELSRNRPGARCLVVGTSAEMIGFLRERLPVSCESRGLIAHDEVAEILGNAKVGIDVHPWLDRHLEPALAVKVCEYMACGCAVVASWMPVLANVLSRSASRLPGIATIRGGEPSDYADAVLAFLAGIDAGEDSGSDLRRFALEHMNWQNEASRIGSLYRSLVDGTSCAT